MRARLVWSIIESAYIPLLSLVSVLMTLNGMLGENRADTVESQWDRLVNVSTELYNQLSKDTQPAFYQLVHHPVIASANLNKLLITTGKNALRASQAFLSTNELADTAEKLFEQDFDLEQAYHSMLDGKIVRQVN